MPLQLDDLAALDAPMQAAGVPLMLALDSIDEDPHQPRQEFEDGALSELAQTIQERGVRQPISVRPSPTEPGRWVLNFGARRLRASRLAGAVEIPAFVDTTADRYDQVIENEQREGLRPLEIALFVQRRLASGDSQTEIARRLGKSRQYVTLATALIDAPDWLLELYRQGRCDGIAELYALRKLDSEHPESVRRWCTQCPSITRGRVAELRQELANGASRCLVTADAKLQTVDEAVKAPAPREFEPSALKRELKSSERLPRLHVAMGGSDFELVVSTVPQAAGELYVRPLSGGPLRSVPAHALILKGFVR
jgi:ParB family chromosome partitioning protein